MQLTKTGKLLLIFATLLLCCGYIAYRNSKQQDTPPKPVQPSEQVTGEREFPASEREPTRSTNSKIDALLRQKDPSEINPSDIDSLFDEPVPAPEENSQQE